jgi:hypothetical protein
MKFGKRAGRLITVVLVFATLASVSLSLGAQSKDNDKAYKDGLNASEKDQWKEVVGHMLTAIANDSNEDERKVKRGALESGNPYLPYILLGIAYQNTQQCPKALDAWAVSRSQGKAKSKGWLTSRESGEADCRKQGFIPEKEFEKALQDAKVVFQAADTRYRNATKLPRAGEFRDPLQKVLDDITRGREAQQQAEKSKKKADVDAFRDVAKQAGEKMAALEMDILKPPAVAGNSGGRSAPAGGTGTPAGGTGTLAGGTGTPAGGTAPPPPSNNIVDEAAKALKPKIAEFWDADRALSTLPLSASELDRRKLATQSVAEIDGQLPGWRDRSNAAAIANAGKVVDTQRAVLTSIGDDVSRREKDRERRQADRQREELSRAISDSLGLMDRAFSAYERHAAVTQNLIQPGTTNKYEALKKQANGLKEAVKKAAGNPEVKLDWVPRRADEYRRGVETLSAQFAEVTLRERGVHEGLQQGAQLYLSGNFQGAIAALETVPISDGLPLRLHVHLFRAAAEYQLYVASGEKEKERLDRARTEIDRCKQIDTAFRPDGRVFGPRFLDLFAEKLAGDLKPAPSR